MPLKISRILHAGYVFEFEKTQIVFDPIFENPFSKNCYAYPNVQFDIEKIKSTRFSAIFISHFHDDHCSLESLNLLDKSIPIYIYCLYKELFSMIKELGFANVYPLKIGESVTIGKIEITPLRALDADVDSIFHIKVAGINILNVVDSWIDSETMDLLSQTSPWDMVLWPFQTMREIEVLSPLRAHAATRELPEEWLEQLNILKPRFIVPSSCQFVQEDWSWYNQAFFPISYAIFKKQIESALPDTHVTRMNPSASFILDKSTIQKAESLSWIKPIGQQDLDYQYDSNLKPPSTAETSKRFLALDVKQTERVFSYCRLGLLEKYKLIAQDFDPYFEKSKLWRLSIYDHTGKAEHFFYKLKGKKIELTNDTGGQLSWTTEIPISKLYGALEYGESLTSLYIRINDMVFNPEIEKKIASVDIVEDPLIRCLFNDAFGAYQKAQLVQIKEKNNN